MRTLKHPPEWQASCHKCHAVLAYNRDDVSYNKFLVKHQITCPHCGAYIEVHEDERRRLLVEESEVK